MLSEIEYAIAEIKDQYLLDDGNLPWIVGFSGGKDSTAMLQLIWSALSDIYNENPNLSKRYIHVVCNNTLVENFVVSDYVTGVLRKIKNSAHNQDIPILVHETIPRLEDSFWVNVIGRGYPVPNNYFRWCTDKLKIKPTSRFMLEQVSENGAAIILIGTRKSESSQRAKSMKKHKIHGKRLTKHPEHQNTFIYAPIRNLGLAEVWYIIHTMSPPWGGDNSELAQIYSDASADDYECPTMVTDTNHLSCGNSRFGCWTCTVVREDKSMSALIENGKNWLMPLLKLRQSMLDNRNISENRSKTRRNKQLAVTKEGHHQGHYTEKYRRDLLEEVLLAQKEIQNTRPDLNLITNQELVAIQVIWNRESEFKYRVSDIYNKIYDKEMEMKANEKKFQKERELLREACKNEAKDFELIENLLRLQKDKALLNRKKGLKSDMESAIEKYTEEGIV